MKLFITNKKEFEDNFNDLSLTRKMHIEAFNELKLSIDSSFSIPLCLTPSYDDNGCAILDFVNKKDDIYFYQFTTTAK